MNELNIVTPIIECWYNPPADGITLGIKPVILKSLTTMLHKLKSSCDSDIHNNFIVDAWCAWAFMTQIDEEG